MNFSRCWLLLFATLMLAPVGALAQFAPLGGPDLSLIVTPENPSAGETIVLSAKSTLLDLSQSHITWYINGNIVDHGIGLVSISARAGNLGSSTEVSVAATGPEGSVSASATIRPATLDLLWEAHSFTPPLFRGRMLPSASSQVRFEAVPQFVRDGVPILTREITFIWKKNGAILKSISGRGSSSALLEMSPFGDRDTVSVEATTQDGFRATASVTLPVTEPSIVLYEDNPLFGVLYNRAFPTQSSLQERGVTIAAVPYYAPIGAFEWNWSVNGKPVKNNPARPEAITINAGSSDGLAAIELALSQPGRFLFNIAGAWTILLNSTASGNRTQDSNISNPFRGPDIP